MTTDQLVTAETLDIVTKNCHDQAQAAQAEISRLKARIRSLECQLAEAKADAMLARLNRANKE